MPPIPRILESIRLSGAHSLPKFRETFWSPPWPWFLYWTNMSTLMKKRFLKDRFADVRDPISPLPYSMELSKVSKSLTKKSPRQSVSSFRKGKTSFIQPFKFLQTVFVLSFRWRKVRPSLDSLLGPSLILYGGNFFRSLKVKL